MTRDNLGIMSALEAMSILGALLNSVCICYVVRCFNIKKPVFLLLLIDAILSCTGCCISAICCLIMDNEYLPCLILVTSNYVPVLMGYMVTSEIALIRLYSIKQSFQNVRLNETKVRNWSLFTLTLFLLYILSLVVKCVIKDLPLSLMVEACMKGEEAEMPSSLNHVHNVLPCIICSVTSLVADTTIVCMLKNKQNNNPSCASGIPFETIPIRATACSALTLLPILGWGILMKRSGQSKVTAASGNLVLLLLLKIFRCPAETFISCAYKSKQEVEVREEKKKIRLRKVLRDAEEARALRAMVRLSQERRL